MDILRARNSPLTAEEVGCIFWQTCKAVQALHSLDEPLVHRDLKIENLLLTSDGVVKLCDFGSATARMHFPGLDWSASQRGLLEEEMAKNTTPMYRSPEMVDTWNNFPITTAADVWALGCVLYVLCYQIHPFEDGAKLRILNGNFTLPTNDGRYDVFHDLIRSMLKVDPRQRPTVSDVLDRLAAIAETRGFNMKTPLKIAVPSSSPQHAPSARPAPPSPQPPRRPPPPSPTTQRHIPAAATQPPPNLQHQQNAGLFSSLKGGAGSLFKNLKVTSLFQSSPN